MYKNFTDHEKEKIFGVFCTKNTILGTLFSDQTPENLTIAITQKGLDKNFFNSGFKSRPNYQKKRHNAETFFQLITQRNCKYTYVICTLVLLGRGYINKTSQHQIVRLFPLFLIRVEVHPMLRATWCLHL